MKRALPWRGPGAEYKRERNEKEKKTTEKQRHSQGERQRARARTGTSANVRKPEEARQEGQKPRTWARTRAKGKEQTKQANHHGKSLNQEEREKGKEAKEKDHECSESTVHEFDTRCDRNRPVPPP